MARNTCVSCRHKHIKVRQPHSVLNAAPLLTEGQYIVMDGVKRRHGHGTHASGNEKYIGEWQYDSMHGQGDVQQYRLLGTAIRFGSRVFLALTRGKRNLKGIKDMVVALAGVFMSSMAEATGKTYIGHSVARFVIPSCCVSTAPSGSPHVLFDTQSSVICGGDIFF